MVADQLIEDFLALVANADAKRVARMLSECDDTDALCAAISLDGEDNNALHVAAATGDADIVRAVLGSDNKRAFLAAARNASGLTPLDLAMASGQKHIVWMLLQCGGASATHVEGRDMLNAAPSFNGESFLHVFARSNYASEIKLYCDSCEGTAELFERCLRANADGDLPAMVAAKKGHKEALLALLRPFLNVTDATLLRRLLHQQNCDGHALLALVCNFQETLFAAHGIVIEMEALAHNHDAVRVKECFRTLLGSSDSAAFSVGLFGRIQRRFSKTHIVKTFLTLFVNIFVLHLGILVIDIFTDAQLLTDYMSMWTADEANATLLAGGEGRILEETCNELAQFPHLVDQSMRSVSLLCYAEAVRGRERFVTTAAIISLPFALYLFEMLHFRTLSYILESRKEKERRCNNNALLRVLLNMLCPLGNIACWLLWPLVTVFRTFWFRFRLKAFPDRESETSVMINRRNAREAALISSRALVMEVCTEASLQPLFQFYLVFIDFVKLGDLQKSTVFEVLSSIVSGNLRQVLSVTLSVATLAWAYTNHYRRKKENSMRALPCAVYFISVMLLVVSRVLCFQLLALYLGPGEFRLALAAVGAHVAIAASVHFIFSDSLAQFQRGSRWLRFVKLLLVLQNCVLNGLANMFVHNSVDLEINVRGREDLSPMDFNARQRTFVRQTVFDLVFLAENVVMIWLGSRTETSSKDFAYIYMIVTAIIVGCYVSGMALKVLFYCFCHPWAELIRPIKLTKFASSVVVMGRAIEYSVDLAKCSVKLKPDREYDRRRCRKFHRTDLDRLWKSFRSSNEYTNNF
jgi:hypothetical protein